ncbi:VRR-NUC domain-containing protein [Nitrincola sp. MINF-07-Sa-05]|uniref:VRR-NUC domain-containing protein n=1 Tax=Nitrincola salilacus TaxID=3400273 RepID=UPI003917C365
MATTLNRPHNFSSASLDNPLYYLSNMKSVLCWVLERHADLLLSDELGRLTGFLSLPQPSQALLVRMVMRKGELFRSNKLIYAEIGDITNTLPALIDAGLIDPDPEVDLAQLFKLLTRAELMSCFQDQLASLGLARSTTKPQLLEALTSLPELAEKRSTLHYWWPEAQDRLIRLMQMPLFDRVRLMFFGNLRQDWSEFVLTELGHQTYEPIPFSPDSRAFSQRDEVNSYLKMHHCREQLDEGIAPERLIASVPPEPLDNPWLEARRARLLFTLAQTAERQGLTELALDTYRISRHREARVRRLRVLERQGQIEQAWPILCEALVQPVNEAEALSLQRLYTRIRKRLQTVLSDPQHPLNDPDYPPVCQPKPEPSVSGRQSIPTHTLLLPPHPSVELAVAEHLSEPDAPACYVENTLFNALFALLCWEALYAPLPGAFFHPFHAAPTDLYREDFVARRQTLFNQCLSQLEDGSYAEQILHNWQAKQGITTPFIYWPLLPRETLELALTCIPAADLRQIFERFLRDLREHRAGLPDLIQFWPEQKRYRLIEVKGPGDRLQDHQTRWLHYLLQRKVDLCVCHVRWDGAE